MLERALAADTRKGVISAVRTARARLDAEDAESARLAALYDLEEQLRCDHGASVSVGLDEVGRGPLAGPLAVGAVVLPRDAVIEGLDDSKRLDASVRERIAAEVRERADAWTVQYASVDEIDSKGVTGALVLAFRRALDDIEAQGFDPGIVLLDGNPLHMDAREVNVVKGDRRVASIAAASVVAKVARDRLMEQLDVEYPGYGFAQNKGYGTAAHIEAIERLGLTPVHRMSFCRAFAQDTLF